MKAWNWIWPRVGSAPSSQSSDSEMFDRADYPYTDTFVREAIQNTLDAHRDDLSTPATITFNFHSDDSDASKPFLEGAMQYRATAGFATLPQWNEGKIKWLTIEDFSTTGLDGALDDRLGNFWNYWLNFNVSNKEKEGAKRGGRGIGRVTFLIASKAQTVLGLTRRVADGVTAACGMTVLRTMRTDDRIVRTTHAYLADSATEDVFNLHSSSEFLEGLATAFKLKNYKIPPNDSGLALVIPYPHDELTAEGILASAIEHFAPAITLGKLVVEVDSSVLNKDTIDTIANNVRLAIRSEAIKADVARFLALVRASNSPAVTLHADPQTDLEKLSETPEVEELRAQIKAGKLATLRISFPLQQKEKAHQVCILAALQLVPENAKPIDRLFREGMSLPDVKAVSPGQLDCALLVEDLELAKFLNHCEGKAHLDLLESKEVKARLEKNGYFYGVKTKRFIKGMPNDLRRLLLPEITKPKKDVFDRFFALPDESGNTKKKSDGNKDKPPPKIQPIKILTVPGGFRIVSNEAWTEWPITINVKMAYADGTRSPEWSRFDFEAKDLSLTAENCECEIVDNRLTAKKCAAGTVIELTGFDTHRELDTRIRIAKNA